jgi:hypothetical protein
MFRSLLIGVARQIPRVPGTLYTDSLARGRSHNEPMLRWFAGHKRPNVLVVLGAVIAATSFYSAQSASTFLAAVRGDGLLVPIAAFDGTGWWNKWPWGAESAEVRQLPIPVGLDEIPADWLPPGLTLPRNWTLQRFSGARSALQSQGSRNLHPSF